LTTSIVATFTTIASKHSRIIEYISIGNHSKVKRK